MEPRHCQLKSQGLVPGACSVKIGDHRAPACQATLKEAQSGTQRLITSVHLSRPENYLSLYQSGCNFACRKCHSWSFSKVREGNWYTPDKLLEKCLEYEKLVTLEEPRGKATAWHAHETCPVFPGKAKVVHVPFPDPPAMAREVEGEDARLNWYRQVRDEIRAFVKQLPEILNTL